MGVPVALATCASYDADALDEALSAALGALDDWSRLFDGDPVVLLKPNLLAPRSVESAITTHPAFVAAVVRAVRRHHDGELLLGDGPAIGTATMAARKLGLPRLLAPYDVRIVDFVETVDVLGGGGFGPLPLARPLVEADRVINLPRVKTHGQMGLTLAVKNLFGAYVGFHKPRLHLTAGQDYATFARMLLETARRVDADLAIADGVVGMQGNGPSAGDPRSLGVIGASASAVALDTALGALLGFPASELPIQTEAARQGRPGARLDDVDLRGEPLARWRIRDWQRARQVATEEIFLPGVIARPLRHQLTTRPAFDHVACTRCQQCLQHCAAGALRMAPRHRWQAPGPLGSDLHVALDLDRCIRCYCCQEICPEGAISVSEGVLLRLSRAARGRR